MPQVAAAEAQVTHAQQATGAAETALEQREAVAAAREATMQERDTQLQQSQQAAETLRTELATRSAEFDAAAAALEVRQCCDAAVLFKRSAIYLVCPHCTSMFGRYLYVLHTLSSSVYNALIQCILGCRHVATCVGGQGGSA